MHGLDVVLAFQHKISKYFAIGLVMSRKSVFENMGTGISSLEINQEPESREDPEIARFEIP